MIKAVGRTGAGQPLLVLGLSGENMTRLMADEPILIRMGDVGLPDCVVAIVGGRTEDAIAEALEAGGLLERLANPEAGG